ncbi:MAG: hypothetical protein OEX02_10680 [Cyclobacteriaceae bacterium]|nr:hypothetical protein [Cyclobacteriaceae bacterium]
MSIWLTIKHASGNHQFTKAVLPQLKKALEESIITEKHYATLQENFSDKAEQDTL